MRCEIHDIEMLYGGESAFGEDVYFCEECLAEEEAEIERRNEPEEFGFDFDDVPTDEDWNNFYYW